MVAPLDPVAPGSIVVLDALLIDAGPNQLASGVMATIVLPAGVEFLGSVDPDRWTATVDGRSVTLIDSTPLASAESRTLSIVLVVGPSASTSSIQLRIASGPAALVELRVLPSTPAQVPVQLPSRSDAF